MLRDTHDTSATLKKMAMVVLTYPATIMKIRSPSGTSSSVAVEEVVVAAVEETLSVIAVQLRATPTPPMVSTAIVANIADNTGNHISERSAARMAQLRFARFQPVDIRPIVAPSRARTRM
jgi:hypothetical protein